MIAAMIEADDGTVRIHGKSQGFKGLPVRHVDRPLEGDPNTMVHIIATAWTPTPEELVALNAGANVIIEQWAQLPSPMKVYTGNPPTADNPFASAS